jgi:hypothetical protein
MRNIQNEDTDSLLSLKDLGDKPLCDILHDRWKRNKLSLIFGSKDQWVISDKKLTVIWEETQNQPIQSYLMVKTPSKKGITFFMTIGHTFLVYYDPDTDSIDVTDCNNKSCVINYKTYKWI